MPSDWPRASPKPVMLMSKARHSAGAGDQATYLVSAGAAGAFSAGGDEAGGEAESAGDFSAAAGGAGGTIDGPEGAPAGVDFESIVPLLPPGGVWPEAAGLPIMSNAELAAGLTLPNASLLCSAQNNAIKHTTIQIAAVMIVIRVNTSPA